MKIPVSNLETLREAASVNTQSPFCWFNPKEREDVKPYLAKLKAEYIEKRHPILLRSIGQGGIYAAESHWLICQETDGWIRRHLSPLIAISEVLPETQPIFWNPGCIGDIIASLPIMRQVGGAHLIITNFKEEKWHNRNLEGARYESIRPLLESQPYVKSVSFQRDEPERYTHNLADWRVKHGNRTLTESQADYLGIQDIDMSPWLTGIKPSLISQGKVVIARTPRYQSPIFPWGAILDHEYHVGRFLFVGLPEEHQAFELAVSRKIPYQPTANLLEVAELIAGSALFIGNQSSPCWIAMALGHRLIQEVSPDVQDSMVKRQNAQFVLQGNIEIRPL